MLPAWWVSHLERDASEPDYHRFFERLTARFRVVRYDRVGVGMSDRARRVFTLASELADLAALIDHLAAPRLNLLGFSCAGPIALAYAAENPDRIDRVVLYGSYLWGDTLAPNEVKAALIGLVRANGRLGSRTLADIFHPSADPEARKRFNDLQRQSADPETAARLLELSYSLDARPFVDRVRAPVLVIHRREDHAIRHAEARVLAASLPDATLCTLSGPDHMPWHYDGDAVVDATAAFLCDGAAPRRDAPPPEAGAELRREGEVWCVRFEGRQATLRDSKGLTDLARLLGRPGEEVHVLDLIGACALERRDAERGDLALDARALAGYRHRLEELDEAIEDAEERADLSKKNRLAEEKEALLDQLAADTGLKGRARRLNDPVERARKAVAARLRDAIRRLKAADPTLGAHFETAVRTGIYCAYCPSKPVRWTVSADPS